jgi:probable rRNA maturation factor
LGERACGELTVRVVGESEATRLNERYRHRQGATNVLAFQFADMLPATVVDPPPLGDLVICAPVLEREAADQGKPLDDHWAHIAIHGALHLLGYDHQTREDAEVMEAKEIELLQGLGIGDPYAEDA